MKILYHANCNDGSGAALVAWMYFGDKLSTGRGIAYIPVQYGQEPPEIEKGEKVFILDFSYKKDVLLKMAKKAGRITIIDHHKTAKEDLSDPEIQKAPNINCIFNMECSGATLTWDYFYCDIPTPKLLTYIEDRDIWNNKYSETKAIARSLQLYPDWRSWKHFLENPSKLDDLIQSGEVINRYLHLLSASIIETPPIEWELYPAKVPVYNLPGFMLSDTLHLALERWPEAPFAVGYFDFSDVRVYSLRSRKGSDVDVSKIAKKHDGGGHKHAAGFSLELKIIKADKKIDRNKILLAIEELYKQELENKTKGQS